MKLLICLFLTNQNLSMIVLPEECTIHPHGSFSVSLFQTKQNQSLIDLPGEHAIHSQGGF